MRDMKERYIVDQNGKKLAVVLDLKAYQALLEEMASLEDALGMEEGARKVKKGDKGLSFIGSGSSGKTDISVRHDDYLAEDFK